MVVLQAVSGLRGMLPANGLRARLFCKAFGLLLGRHTAVHTKLHPLAPSLVAGPVLPGMLQGRLAYRQVLQGLAWDLGCLCAALAGLVACLVRLLIV